MSRVEESYALNEVLPASHWSTKLSTLQSQHKKETIHQQREHLEQLHLLQDQLLEEISLNMNLTARELGVSSTSPPNNINPLSSSRGRALNLTDLELDPSDRTTPFLKSAKTPRSPPPNSRRNVNTFGGHSSPRPCDTTGSVFGSTPYSPISAWGEGGAGTSNEEPDVVISVRCPQHGLSTPQTISRTLVQPCSTSVNAGPLRATSPAIATVRPNSTSPRPNQARVNWINETTPLRDNHHHHHHHTPSSKGPSPSPSSHPPPRCPHTPPHCSYSPPQCQHTPQHCSHSPPHCPLDPIPTATTTTTTWAGKSHDNNLARAALVGKHTKHIEDLKQYYESEISSLEKKLNGSGKKATPTRRVLDFDVVRGSPTTMQQQGGAATPSPCHHHHHPCCHSARMGDPSARTRDPTESAALARVKALQGESARLETECSKLRDMLEKSRR